MTSRHPGRLIAFLISVVLARRVTRHPQTGDSDRGVGGSASTTTAAQRHNLVRVKLAELQDLMETLYGTNDRERGVPSTVAWLCEEVGELAQAVRKGTREQQLHEFADVLAWVASLANQMDISLDEAVQRYVDNPP